MTSDEFRKALAGVEPLLEQLDELGKLRAPLPPGIGGGSALELLLRVLEDGTFTLPGEPLQGVQVLRLLARCRHLRRQESGHPPCQHE
jgi:hypothetical protein